MEGFNNMMMKAVDNEWIRGFQANNRLQNSVTITHLLYADDTLVFCEATMGNVMHLRLILTIFEGISGLHVNWEKSTVYSVNQVDDVHIMAGILGCGVGTLPTTYLGLALGAKNKAMEIWNGVIEKCEKRLATWKAQYLSLGGRVVLINSVLDSLPTYVMSLFPLPVKVEKRLDILRRNFLWQGNSGKKTFNLVRWSNVVKTKKEGGLGIKNLRIHNESLLSKWLWRFTREEHGLWRNVITQKYGNQDEWHTKSVNTPFGVSNWKAIRRQWDDFSKHIRFKHGNGRKIAFWNDNWLGHGPLRDTFPEIYSLTNLPEAKLWEVRDQHGWNLSLRRPLNDWEFSRIAELFKSLEEFTNFNECEDIMEWNVGRGKPFTVRAAYSAYSNREQQEASWPWKMIWKTQVPLKVACFSWLVSRRACLTHENLQRRGFLLTSRCFLCNNHSEDNSHLFLHCPVTYNLWQFFLSLAGVKCCMPKYTQDMLAAWSQLGGNIRHRKWWCAIPHCIWWTVWKERNGRCFEDTRNPIQKVKLNCILLLHFWCKHQFVNETDSLIQFLESL